jgi:hypothetical protein
MAVFCSFHRQVVGCAAWLRSGLSGAAIAAVGLVCAGLPAADAANFTCSWNDAAVNWTTVADWSSCNSAFPNNGGGNTYDVTISTGDPTLTTVITIGSATITSTGAWGLSGSGADATLTGSVANSGDLEVHVALRTGGNLTNSGTFNIDTGFNSVGSGEGGSNVTVGGTLTNNTTLTIGNPNLNAPTTVSAAGFTNSGTVNLLGNTTAGSTNQATMTVNGQASNSGTVNLPTTTSLTVTGTGNAYSQTGGSTNLSGGTLAAPNVNITGGKMQGMGTVTGAANISRHHRGN